MNEEELLKETGLYNKRFIAVVKNGFVDFIQDKIDKNNGILFIDRDVIRALTKVKEKYKEENIDFYNDGFQKGKLKQKKEELMFLLIMKEHIETNNCPSPTLRLNDRIKQLQKEIGGNEK